MSRLDNHIPQTQQKTPYIPSKYKPFNNISPTHNNLISFIKIIPNIESFYNFNKYNLLNPHNTYLIDDPNYKEYFVNNYKKRQYNNKPLLSITDYDPFFPQNFFVFWELLHNLDRQCLMKHKFGFIDNGIPVKQYNCVPLGHIEAVIRFCEYCTVYENNIYIRVPLQKMVKYEADNKFLEIYNNQLTHEFIKESYDINAVKRIHNYYKNSKFDFVVSVSDDIFQNLISLLICANGGTCVIYIKNYIIDDIDNYIYLLSSYFKGIRLYQPECQHLLISECYVILSDFIGINNDNEINKLFDIISNKVLPINDSKTISKIRLNYTSSYRDNLIEFMDTLTFNNDSNEQLNKEYYTLEDHVSAGLEWCKKFHMRPKSYYNGEEQDDFTHEYLKCTLSNRKLSRENILKDVQSFRDTKMHELKNKLNNYKRIIDTKEQFVKNDIDNDIVDWHKLTDCVDLFRNLRQFVIQKYNSEMVNNSFLKTYEILCNENIVDKNANNLETFHICETHGASICSINQYLLSNTRISNFTWYAQSVNQYADIDHNKYSQLTEYKYGLIKYHKDKWLFGENRTGDITCQDTINSYAADRRLKYIDIITCDGALIIPSNKYNEQEGYVAHIIYSEILTVLTILPRGRNCTIRCFIPFAETITISYLYLLTMVFSTVNIVKPLTSHPSSSEVYIVCKDYVGYGGIPFNIKNMLYHILNNFNVNYSIFPQSNIPDDFINELYQCSSIFVENQIKSICRTLYYRYKYYVDYDNQDIISENREKSIEKWLDKYYMRDLNPRDSLMQFQRQQNYQIKLNYNQKYI